MNVRAHPVKFAANICMLEWLSLSLLPFSPSRTSQSTVHNTLLYNSHSESRAPSYPLTLSRSHHNRRSFDQLNLSTSNHKDHPPKVPTRTPHKFPQSTYTRSQLHTGSSLFTGRSVHFKKPKSPLVSTIKKQTSSNNVHRCRIRPCGQPPS